MSSSLVPPVVATLEFLFFDERLALAQMLGMAGVALASKS